MTEYWVSQAKYYCKYCNIWMADNNPSRLHHDSGLKHKERVAQANKEKRAAQLHGMRSERELRGEMEAIERAARQALAQDRDDYAGMFVQNVHVAPSRPMPPPSLLPSSSSSSGYGDKSNSGGMGDNSRGMPQFDDAGGPIEAQDSSGEYTVNGVRYLQGSKHEDELRAGAQCEIFNELEDDWLPAVITQRREIPVPHTSLVRVLLSVRYDAAGPEEHTAASEMIEDNVTSDRLRLVKKEQAEKATPAVVESTGIGGWQTVSVRTVDEAEERRKLAEDHERELREERDIKERLAAAVRESVDSGDILRAYDPHGTGMYKGVVMTEEAVDTELASVAKGKAVSFKKRKVSASATSASNASSSSSSTSRSAGDLGVANKRACLVDSEGAGIAESKE